MFDNTLSVTIDGEVRVLTRINQDKLTSQYRYADGDRQVALFIRHTTKPLPNVGVSQDRHNVELTVTTYDVNRNVRTRKAYLTFEHPSDMANDVADDPLMALTGLFATPAMSARLQVWES